MAQEHSKEYLLSLQIKELQRQVEQIRPEEADFPGMPGSGISALIIPYNNLLIRYKNTFSRDLDMGLAIIHVGEASESIPFLVEFEAAPSRGMSCRLL